MPGQNNIASIDLGSNSCRLRIADRNGHVLFKDSVSTKLGEGLFQTKRLSEASIQRGLQAFQKFSEIMSDYHVTSYRAVATAACRMAQNGQEFLRQVKKNTHINVEIISPEEEARLNLKGSLLNAPKDRQYAVVYDLGGASTEITLAPNDGRSTILYTTSIPLGARNASEAYCLEEFNNKNAEKLQADIKVYVDDFINQSGFDQYHDNCCLIATSSTPLRLCSIVKNHGSYRREANDGAILEKKGLDKAIEKCCAMSLEQRKESPYIGEDRASVFVAAGLIFQSIYENLGFNSLIVSFKGAQDAILEELKNGEVNKISKTYSRQKKLNSSR